MSDTNRPWTFGQAVAVQKKYSDEQEQAERFVKTAYKDFAEAERAYREALAKKITELRAAGNSVTLCGDLARGDEHVALLKYKRDVAEGVREAAGQAVWRATADRRAADAFTAWSQRRDIAEGYAPVPHDRVFESPIGGRR
jgi:hypothetical protein